jgi:hypothetical protein
MSIRELKKRELRVKKRAIEIKWRAAREHMCMY